MKKVEAAAISYPEVLKADINTYFDALIQSLEQIRQQLLVQAEAECQSDLKQVWADKTFHQTTYTCTMSEMKAVFGLAKKALKNTSDVEMITTALRSIKVLSWLQETQ